MLTVHVQLRKGAGAASYAVAHAGTPLDGGDAEQESEHAAFLSSGLGLEGLIFPLPATLFKTCARLRRARAPPSYSLYRETKRMTMKKGLCPTNSGNYPCDWRSDP